jgi:autotransporter translocation and assembly factor TamB
MKRLRQILVAVVILVILVASIGLQPRLWRGEIETLLNRRLLADRGWRVSIQSLGGHFLSAVTSRGIVFTHEDGATVSINRVVANFNFSHSLFSGLTLDQLTLEGIVLTLPPADSVRKVPIKLPYSFQSLLAFNVAVRQLSLTGRASAQSLGLVDPITFSLAGAVRITHTEGTLALKVLQLEAPSTKRSLALKDLNLTLTPQALVVDNFRGTLDTLRLEGSGSLELLPEKHLAGDLFIRDYVIPQELFTQLPLQPKFSNVDVHVTLQSDLRRYAGSLELTNALGLNMEGAFQMVWTGDYLRLEEFTLRREAAELQLTGLLEKDGRINGKMVLTHFDMSRWLEQQKPSNLSGTVFLEGTLHQRQLQEVTLTMEMEETALFVDRPITASGTIIYAEKKLSIPNPLTVTIGPSSVILKGECDLGDSTLDIQVELNDASVFLINNFWADSLEGGTASGTLTLTGDLQAPDVEADLTGKQVKYHQAYLEEFVVNTRLKRLRRGMPTWSSRRASGATIPLVAARWS